MKRILLMGNPNVGKSAVFSRLTGARVNISNYPGATVEFTQGYMKINREKVMIIDVPGCYSLEPSCKAEEVALAMLSTGDLVINVIDSTNLERNLYLTLELLERKIPVIIALNIWDDTKHKGIDIDIKKLAELLQVPIIPTCGLTGEGIKDLVMHFSYITAPSQHGLLHLFKKKHQSRTSRERWRLIGDIISQVQELHHRHHSFLETLQDASVRPVTGIPLAIIVVLLAFTLTRLLGEGLIYIIEPLFTNVYAPLLMRLSTFLGSGGFIHNILIGKLIDGQIDFGLSFGLLTTGLFVPLVMVLPYIFSFYLILGILEDFGYLPRLAVLMDNLMHHLGLHGYAIIPMILGLGCNVPGALATRLLQERREKFIAASLMAIAVPCMAQIAVIVGLLGKRGGQYVVIVFVTLFLIWLILGRILHHFLKGESPELILEIPPYRIPQPLAVIKKLWMRIEAFLCEAIPFVLLGILFVNVLYTLKIVDSLAHLFAPVLTGLWGLPPEAISALILGFLRKDVAIGMLGPLNLTTKQLVIGCTILAVYFPCIATFIVLVKELGIKDMFKSALLMIIVALITGTLLNLIL